MEAKICVILSRDFGINISESSVGRIMTKLRFLRSRSALRCRQKRRFKEHYSKIGKLSNRSHDCKNCVVMMHFAGIERFSEHVYSNTNSDNATKFLRELIENAPYKVCFIFQNQHTTAKSSEVIGVSDGSFTLTLLRLPFPERIVNS